MKEKIAFQRKNQKQIKNQAWGAKHKKKPKNTSKIKPEKKNKTKRKQN